jgi:hypothetical protein
VFPQAAGVLAGLKLVGFSLWRSPEGETYVTFPSRAFGAGQERRFFDYLRSANGGAAAAKPLTRCSASGPARADSQGYADARRAGPRRAAGTHVKAPRDTESSRSRPERNALYRVTCSSR